MHYGSYREWTRPCFRIDIGFFNHNGHKGFHQGQGDSNFLLTFKILFYTSKVLKMKSVCFRIDGFAVLTTMDTKVFTEITEILLFSFSRSFND